ncbi:hypothetical protein KFL_017260010, partial [Klebsormidium nitens]
MASIPPTPIQPVIVNIYTREELSAAGHLDMFAKRTTKSDALKLTTTAHKIRKNPGIPTLVKDLASFARTIFGITTTPVDMLRGGDLVFQRIITADAAGPFTLPPSATDVPDPRAGYSLGFMLIQVLPRPPLRAVKFYHPATEILAFQLAADGTAVYLLLPAYFVQTLAGAQAAMDEWFTAERLAVIPGELVRLEASSLSHALVLRAPPPAPEPAAASAPPRLQTAELAQSLLPLGTIILGDRTRSASDLLAALRGAGVTTAMLPSAPTREESTTGPPQYAFLAGAISHVPALLIHLQDVASAGCAPALTSYLPPSAGKGVPYQLQQSCFIAQSVLSRFSSTQSAAASIQSVLRTFERFSSVDVLIMPDQGREDPVLGRCTLVRIFSSSITTFIAWLDEFPDGVPISITLPDGTQVTPCLKLRAPSYGYVKYSPGDSLLTAADTQLLMTCDDPQALLLAGLTMARVLYGLDPLTTQDEDDVVFTEEDVAGNPTLGFSTGAVLAVILTQTGLSVYPEGTAHPQNKITVCPFLRSVANSVKHVKGQRTPPFEQLTYNRFPAVAPIVTKLIAASTEAPARDRAVATAPLIVDITAIGPGADADMS